MTTPRLSPTPRVMQEAIAWQLARVPRPRPAFDELDAQGKQLAFTIAGFARQSVLESAHAWLTKGLAEGLTRQEILDQVGKLADQEGIFLSPARLDLIAQNHLANVQANGRWQQLNDPDLLAVRPYRQYPLGPSDVKTSDFCRKMEGVVWLAGDPIEEHVIPPNHHKERHLKIGTLTKAQAEASGKLYTSPKGGQYPVIDGQTILPDPGFDAPPRLLAADADDLRKRVEAAGDVVPLKTPAAYGLEDLQSRAEALALEAPDEMDADSWRRFQQLAQMGRRKETIVVDQHGDGVLINEATFQALDGKLAAALRRIITDPLEIWYVRRESGFSRRYLALLDQDDEIRGAWLEVSREGWLFAGDVVELGDLEQLRGGLLLTSKVRKGN
ncbi:MAG: PBECR2 nuclease fold domain-containing protein [Thermoanaerobaculia bacterium]